MSEPPVVIDRAWVQRHRERLEARADQLKADWQACQGALELLASVEAQLPDVPLSKRPQVPA